MKRHGVYFLICALLVALDQITKAAIVKAIPLYSSRTVIPGFFDLTHIQNRGAIFGFFNHSGSPLVFYILTAVSAAATLVILVVYFKSSAGERWMKTALILILAGAIGNNMIDRIFKGYVIDFLDFYIGKAHWPSFNIADSCISIGAVLMVMILFLRRK